MIDTDSQLSQVSSLAWTDKISRQIIISLFRRFPDGLLILKEKGVLVERLGNAQSNLHAEIDILDSRCYSRLLFGGSVAAGETYTDGWWTSNNLTNVIRLFARNMQTLDEWEQKLEWLALPIRKVLHLSRRNSLQQAKSNIAAHYDLGNELYTRFLDPDMQYSSAMYADRSMDLAQAQQYKLQRICDKLDLKADDHLLEIGSGWGGLAIYAARHYGCQVTTTTISDEQFDYAKQQIEAAGLSEKIHLLKQDYRLLTGQYDKLVSIEMIEAVGKRYLPTFFRQCNNLLKPDGLMLLQSITINDQRYDSYSKGVDFIQKHIFPGGFLPSQLVINQHLQQHTELMIRDLQDIGLDYAKTLQQWWANMQTNQSSLNQLGYDQRFMRLWHYYMSYCEGGFMERTISTVQLLLTRPGNLNWLCR